MRICMVASVPFPPTEGIGHYVWNLSRFLISQEHEVQIITRGEWGKPVHEELDGIQVWRPFFAPAYPFHVHLHGVFVQKLIRRLEGQVDVFHLHTPLPPPVDTVRPMLLTVHSMVRADSTSRKVNSVFDLLNRLQTPISAQVEVRLVNSSDSVVAVSKPAGSDAAKVLSRGGEVEVVWNGVDTSFFYPGKQEEADRNSLLYVGRLAPGKGLDDLLMAFGQITEQHPLAVLSIAGDGPLLGGTRQSVRRLGLDKRVRFLGHVTSRTALRALYRRAWLVVLPSHHESMPTVVLEAIACGIPVLATSVGSVSEVISDGESGLLVPPRDSVRLGLAMEQVLGDSDFREQLSRAGPFKVRERFSWEVVGRSYLRCYEGLTARGER